MRRKRKQGYFFAPLFTYRISNGLQRQTEGISNEKALVLTLIMVLAVAGIASAEAKLGGELKVEYKIDTDKNDDGRQAEASVPLKLKVTAEEEGVWSIKADLRRMRKKCST